MKKLLFAVCFLLALCASGQFMKGHFKSDLPGSVQQFYLERAAFENIKGLTSKSTLSNWSALKPSFGQPRLIDGIEMLDAFIDITGSDVIPSLKAAGIKVNCEFDGFVTAQIPMSKLDQVHLIPGVTNVEISRMVELCSDSTLSVTHAGQVLNGTEYGLSQAYDGTGIIVGIIDYGFDYGHVAFKKPNGKTRIKRVYNTADSTGHPVIIGGNQAPGTVFMDAQIDTMISDDYRSTHGTHTAGLAVGTHYKGYGGIAPGADIVLCAPASIQWGFLETEIVNCIKYIYAYADSVNKPCVITMSVSTSYGPHDGSDRVSKAVSQLVGPGRVFVIAAGNNASRNLYSFGKTKVSNPVNMLYGCYNSNYDYGYYYDHIQVDTWVREKNTRPIDQFFIFDKKTKRIVWRSAYNNLYRRIDASEISDFFEPTQGNEGYLESLVSLSPMNIKYMVTNTIHNLRCKSYTVDSEGYCTSRYQIGVAIYPPRVMNPKLVDSCFIDSWMYTGNGRRVAYNDVVYVDVISDDGDTTTQAVNNYFSTGSDLSSIGTYAVADSIISAGGFVARDRYYSLNGDSMIVTPNIQIGQYYRYSSYQAEGYGPTGKALPTVVAPAVNVISSVNKYDYYAYASNITVLRAYNNYWGAMSGTSMAAPTVAGIIAQWLQINPNLSPGDIKKVIAKTAIKDAFTMSATDGVRYGPNGKIDAMAGARYLLNLNYTPGDVNCDGMINVEDLTIMVDCLLGCMHLYIEQGYTINELALDFDQDGVFDITDIAVLIDFLLGVYD